MQTLSDMKPNAARMWDFVLGGTYNFAVDREAVELTRKLYPLYEETMLEQRLFLKRAMTFMVTQKKLDKFIDFGSGLPTRGNVHEIVQALDPKAKVVYSDKESIVVVMAKEMLGTLPTVQYVHCDVTKPDVLLDSPVVAQLFGDDRRVGIGVVGIFLYVPDETLANLFSRLYTWAEEGSYIAVTGASEKFNEIEGVEDASREMRLTFYTRSAQKVVDLIRPWKLAEPGLVEGFYWGLPESAPEINSQIQEIGYSFVAYK